MPIVVAMVSILIMGVETTRQSAKCPYGMQKGCGNKMYGQYIRIRRTQTALYLIFAQCNSSSGNDSTDIPGNSKHSGKHGSGRRDTVLWYMPLLILGLHTSTHYFIQYIEISRNLQRMIHTGIRGQAHKRLLSRISARDTRRTVLMLVATVPSILLALFDIDVLSAFGPTNLLIIVAWQAYFGRSLMLMHTIRFLRLVQVNLVFLERRESGGSLAVR